MLFFIYRYVFFQSVYAKTDLLIKLDACGKYGKLQPKSWFKNRESKHLTKCGTAFSFGAKLNTGLPTMNLGNCTME